MRDFISKAHTTGKSVHAMTLEETDFTFPKYHTKGVQLVKWVIDFSTASEPLEYFDGVHIDTEPHSLLAWSKARTNQNWMGMVPCHHLKHLKFQPFKLVM